MNTNRFSRRALLQTLGLGGAALVPLLNSTRAFATGPAFPKRLIVVMQSEGALAPQFFPASAGALTTAPLPTITSPLEPHKRDLLFVGNVRMSNFLDNNPGNIYGAAHSNLPSALTGRTGPVIATSTSHALLYGGPSIDQYILQQLRAAGGTDLPLVLGTQVTPGLSFQTNAFATGVGGAINPDQDPTITFNRIFASSVTDPMAARLRVERRSVLDHVIGDLAGYGRNLGTDDRNAIAAHLQAVRDLETQLTTMTAVCTPPTVASFTNDASPTTGSAADARYPDVLNAEMDLIVAAMRCGLTRVASLQLSNSAGNELIFDWLGMGPTGTRVPGADCNGDCSSYHSLAHANGTGKANADRWYMSQFAALIQKLKSVPEGGGTMFDNTVVLWANHMGNGAAHSSDHLPWILAGSCGGYFSTGRYVNSAAPVHTNQVLQSLCAAMDVSPAGFGDPRWSLGPLSTLTG